MNFKELIQPAILTATNLVGLSLDLAVHSRYSPFERYDFGSLVGDYIGDYQYGLYTGVIGVVSYHLSQFIFRDQETDKKNRISGLLALGTMSLPWTLILLNESLGAFGGTPVALDLIAPCFALLLTVKSFDFSHKQTRTGEWRNYFTG
jgi:hypothetical protein